MEEKKHHCGTTHPSRGSRQQPPARVKQKAGHLEERRGKRHREIGIREHHGAGGPMLGMSDVRMPTKAHPSCKKGTGKGTST